jgi:hypothetical protein
MLYKRKDMKASVFSESAVNNDVVSNLEMENIDDTEKMVEKTGNAEKPGEEPRYSLRYFGPSGVRAPAQRSGH